MPLRGFWMLIKPNNKNSFLERVVTSFGAKNMEGLTSYSGSGSWRRRAQRVLSSKWMMLSAGIWIQIMSGSSYTFGIYSQALKSSLGYDQSTLGTVSSCKDIGANVGVISGLLYGVSPPWAVLLVGALQNSLGYAFLWSAVTHRISEPPLWQVCFFMFLAAHAQTFFNTADAVTAVENFPADRGTVVGIMKGFLGLSGAMLLQMYYTIYEGNQSSFLFMLSWLPSLSAVFFMFVIKVYPVLEGDTKKTLDVISSISLVIAAYLMVVIILEHTYTLNSWSHMGISIGLIIILLLPFAIAINFEISYSPTMPITEPLLSDAMLLEPSLRIENVTDKLLIEAAKDGGSQNIIDSEISSGSEHMTSVLPVGHVEDENLQGSSISEKKIERGDNFSPLQAIGTLDFWLLFMAMACGMGSGLATINNMSQIGISYGYRSKEISTLVSLWSIWNFLGRFGAGYISEQFLHSSGCARPLFIAISLLVMGVGHLIIASGLPGALYAGSILVGICYGCQWSLMPATTSEIFGLKHFGTLFNAIAIASPIGSFVLSVKVVGYIYDNETKEEENDFNVTKTCLGVHCFQLSFAIMSFVAFLGCLIALVLFQRTRPFYKKVVFKRIVDR